VAVGLPAEAHPGDMLAPCDVMQWLALLETLDKLMLVLLKTGQQSSIPDAFG
jgi:hypothetical protein